MVSNGTDMKTSVDLGKEPVRRNVKLGPGGHRQEKPKEKGRQRLHPSIAGEGRK